MEMLLTIFEDFDYELVDSDPDIRIYNVIIRERQVVQDPHAVSLVFS